MDSAPCDDFYQYACGNWLKGIELPEGVDAIDQFSAIADRNIARERELLATLGQSGQLDAAGAKLATFWSACMDEAAIERTAPALVKERLARVDQLKSLQQLALEVAREQRDGVDSLFILRAHPDAADATAPVVASFDQGGLTLPTADDYLRPGRRAAGARQARRGTFARLEDELARHSLADWRAYLRWHIVHSLAPLANKALVDEDFAFFGSTLHGVDKADARATQCVRSADRYLGVALGDLFAQKKLGAAGKDEATAMAHDVQYALKADLPKRTWLDEATRNKAIRKLERITLQIGYPDHEDGDTALMSPNEPYLQDVERARNDEFDRALRRPGKPFDRKQWRVTPASVVGRYDASTNTVTFAAGLLPPPLFDSKAAPPVRFGAMGALIGQGADACARPGGRERRRR